VVLLGYTIQDDTGYLYLVLDDKCLGGALRHGGRCSVGSHEKSAT